MSNKIKTIEEIRAELLDEVAKLGGIEITFIDGYHDRYEVPISRRVGANLSDFVNSLIERAGQQFDELCQQKEAEFEASLKDKQRQLKLGELADQFFQALKLPQIEGKK